MTNTELLDHEFYSDDLAETLSIRDFLCKLLRAVWEEEEGFDGKRPFGNSGWKHDIELELIRLGIVSGTIDERDHYIEIIDRKAAEKKMQEVIAALCSGA